jgi:hypothetical protein
MSSRQEELERAAIDAHERDLSWADFWGANGAAVRAAEPWDRERFRRLVNRLLHLVASGDGSGAEPAGDAEPWEPDDAPAPDDSTTAARCLFPLRPLPGRAAP